MWNILIIAAALVIMSKSGKIASEGLDVAREKAETLIKSREGFRDTVYADSLGNATVGWGHLVTFADGLRVGDKITIETANRLFDKDFEKAYGAAISQAITLGNTNADLVAALSSVNYQLGTGWVNKFPDTWNLLKTGEYSIAISNLNNSLWNRQTPVRVADFIQSIKGAFA